MPFIFLLRTAFLSLFSFEFLHSIKILGTPLNFPWIALAFMSLISWLSWEKVIKKRVEFPVFVGGLCVLQLYTNTIGNVLNYYDRFTWFDHLTHFTGGALAGTAALLALMSLNQKHKWQLSRGLLIIFAISLAISACVLWEFYEYFLEYIFGGNIIADKYDTTQDLLFGFIGMLASIFVLAKLFKRAEKTT